MNELRKIILLLFAFFSLIAIVGGMGTLYYCDVPGSNFFATGLIPVGVVYFYLFWPKLKEYFGK